jgi:hypothetical protein
MPEWKDATSYSQGDPARGRQPDAWEIRDGSIAIWVGSGHRYYPGEWVMNCHALGMKEVQLKLPADQPKELAQAMAINRAANEARQLAAAISRLKASTPIPPDRSEG